MQADDRLRLRRGGALVIATDPMSVDEGKVDFAAFWAVVLRYRFMIAIAGIACATIAGVIAFAITPTFRVTVAITEASNDNLTGGAGGLGGQLGGIASLVGMNIGPAGEKTREYQGVLRSRKLIEDFVQRYDLMPELYPPPKKAPTLWFAVRKFQGGILTIRDDKRSGLTMVDVTWTNPAIAARWANDFVALANETLRNRAMTESKASIAYLNHQLAQTGDVEMQRVMYNLIENETKTLMLANATPEYAFTVVDPGVPPELRTSPHRILMIMFGFVFGLFIGALLALLLNSRNTARQQRQQP
jgi:uncharacterized protein involved in exopolysaccharide biosynthesis